MKATVKITCRACGCSMELETAKWKRSDNLICQSCGQRMDPLSLSALNDALRAIQEVPDIAVDGGGFIPAGEGFELEFIPSPEE